MYYNTAGESKVDSKNYLRLNLSQNQKVEKIIEQFPEGITSEEIEAHYKGMYGVRIRTSSVARSINTLVKEGIVFRNGKTRKSRMTNRLQRINVHAKYANND